MKQMMYVLGIIILCQMFAHGMRVPLDGGGQSSGGTATAASTRVGMVDMEMIFQEFPETRRGKELLEEEMKKAYNETQRQQKEVDELQKEIDEMQKVENSTGKMPGMVLSHQATAQFNTTVSTDVVTNDETESPAPTGEEKMKSDASDQAGYAALLQSKKEMLEKKKSDLEKYRKESETNLLALEERRSRAILDRLYNVLEKIAQEEKLDIILDKNYVLYGQPTIDVTDKLKRRLSGE